MDDQVNLPHDTYTRLIDAAQSEGTTPAGWIEQRLPQTTAKPLDQNGKQSPRNMLEALGDSVGSIHSDGQLRAAERHSELFAEGMEEKRREGRL